MIKTDKFLKDNYKEPTNKCKSTKWCLTLNNPTEEEYDIFKKLPETWPNMIRYFVYQTEVGESNTPHIQGYIQLHQQQRLSWWKKIFTRAHFGIQLKHATNEQCRHYCMKHVEGCTCNHCETARGYRDVRKPDEPLEYGVFCGQEGERSDLMKIKESIQKHEPLSKICDDHFETYVRCHKGIHNAKFLLDGKSAQRDREIETIVLIGPAGIGKTRSVFEEHGYDKVYKLDNDDKLWFDGYEGQPVLLIDDFYGWIKYSVMLNLLDRYPFRCPIKGGHTWARWTTIYITSNSMPESWYKQGLTPALKRRLTTINILGDVEDIKKDDDMNEYERLQKIIDDAQKRLQILRDCEDL